MRGIQLALGLMLAWQALDMMRPALLLGLLAVVIVLALRENRYAPAAVVLMALGVGIAAAQGGLWCALELAFTLPPLTLPRLEDVGKAMLLAGFAQIPLSITNAVIATATLIHDYFPEKAVSERKLMLNMGFMNVVGTFFGGMPMCHSQSIANVLVAFPMPLVGGMMLLVGLQLGKGAVKLRGWKLVLCLLAAAMSVLVNMVVGFAAGLTAAYLIQALKRRRALACLCTRKQEIMSNA